MKTMRIEYRGKPHTLGLNRNGMMFALDDQRHDTVAYLCGRRVDEPLDHNQCWLLREHLKLLVDAGVVRPVLRPTGLEMVIAHEGLSHDDRATGRTHGNEVVLCDIVHPDFNDGGFTPFGDVARGRLGQQCQYASRYVNGHEEYPNLGEGLRFRNLGRGDYHAIEIHRDDVDEFVRRYEGMRRS